MSLKSCTATAALLTALALAPVVAMADQPGSEVAVPQFYQDVMKMKPEGKLGQIIKQEKVDTPIAGAQAWRIAYVSSDHRGVPTINTGLVVAPEGEPPAGGRPILAWAHGTTGVADTCAPSVQARLMFEIKYLNPWLEQGFAVIATDYQGLGVPGPHLYSQKEAV